VSPAILLRLPEGAELTETCEGRLAIRTSRTDLSLAGLGLSLRAALRRLAETGAAEAELAAEVAQGDGPAGLPALYYVLHELQQRCLISYRAAGEQGPLATAHPTSPDLPFCTRGVDLQKGYVFSKFAYLRREDGHMVIESPLSAVQVAVHDARVGAFCAGLATPHRLGEMEATACGLSSDEILALGTLLLSCRVLVEAGTASQAASDDRGALRTWEFHDLLFHTLTRLGRNRQGYGGTYRFAGRIEPLPATKPPMSDEAFDLDRPDLDRLRREDMPLTAALENRRSVRAFGDPPILLRQLGEFLYRTARQRRTFAAETGQQLSSRPYPGGGALYELEVYLSVESCVDLPPGFYHYCPAGHRLFKLSGRSEATARLLHDAALISRQPSPPQVLLTIAARFARVFWKYESMGYALILKDVGVLYQTMYLVAEAMGLSACALGGGNADLFAAAADVDYYEESSVGELILGSRLP